MRCPTLNELTSPPADKTGWPWTEESPLLPDKMEGDCDWPKISIVTPSYNQGRFIEETIRSVLLQGYPNLEYIIIDGGSTDNSVEIINKYEPWLTYWVSEPDRGQSHGINKGFEKATCEVFGWLNSDDYFHHPKTEYLNREEFTHHLRGWFRG
jgi:cellulose synthase/poly-beta-1,6-N-acetylglucosamine synthase-like glycosyltransferase